MPSSIMILGGTSLDTIIHLNQLPAPVPQTIWPQRAYRSVGSTGAGKSLNLAALGHRVTLHTLLGRDAEAETIRQQLAKPGIRLLLETTDTPTEQHVNLMTAAGERISLFVQPPAEPETVDWRPVQERLPETDLVVANILAYVKPALDWLREYGRPVWTDLHDYDGSDSYHQPFIDAADVIFLASDNLPDYRRTMEQLIQGGKSFVVCTHGSAGATLLSSDGKWLEQAAIRVSEVIDTNGAGDAFFSGFLHRYLHGGNLKTCLRAGAMAGALCVTSQDLVSNKLTPEALA